MWTIAGSATAFLIGQLIDVAVFHRLRRITADRMIWLRATGSTLVSQVVDGFVVLYSAFVLGPRQWPISLFLAVGTVNYAYKLVAAMALIPLIYLSRWAIDRWLGPGPAGGGQGACGGGARPGAADARGQANPVGRVNRSVAWVPGCHGQAPAWLVHTG